jgi:hypothetical protein
VSKHETDARQTNQTPKDGHPSKNPMKISKPSTPFICPRFYNSNEELRAGRRMSPYERGTGHAKSKRTRLLTASKKKALFGRQRQLFSQSEKDQSKTRNTLCPEREERGRFNAR